MAVDLGLHLVLSTLITEKRRIVHKGSENQTERSRVDLFLTSLESLKKLSIDSADIYVEFDETTKWAESIVREYISKLPFAPNVYNKRLDSFDSWKQAANKNSVQSAKLVLLISYDDHAFIDKDADEFNELAKNIARRSTLVSSEKTYAILSHFPEMHGSIPVADSIKRLQNFEDMVLVPTVNPIGVLLLKPLDFSFWWEKDFTNGMKIVGPENPFGPGVFVKNAVTLVPRRELFRHLDGYSHARIENAIFKPLKANMVIKTNAGNPTIFQNNWRVTSDIFRLNQMDNFEILQESDTNSNSKNFLITLIKVSGKRLSVKSILYINSIYRLDGKHLFGLILKFSIKEKMFRQIVLKSILEWPLLIFSGITNRFVFRILGEGKEIKYLNLVLQMSSIGFVRLPFRLLKSILTRRSALLFGGIRNVFPKVPRRS
jgi:hypothetical protein